MNKKEHKRCFISGCYGKSDKENTHVGVFGVPKASLSIWQEIVPKDGLTTSSKICSKHFEETDIEKGRVIQDKFYPYSRWTLKPGAVPKLFLGPTTSQRRSLLKTKTALQKCSSSKTTDSSIALPRLLPKGTTSAPSSHACESNKSLPVCGPVTHYIIVPDSLPTVQNSSTTTKPSQNDLSLKTPAAMPPNSSIHLAQNDSIDTTSSMPSICDHDYIMRTAPITVPVEKGSSGMAASRIPESHITSSSAVHDSDHSYGIRPSSSTPTIEEAGLDLDTVGYQDFISGVTFPIDEWCWSFNERMKRLICSCHYFTDDDVMNIKTVRILTKTKVELFVNGKLVTTPDLKLEFQTKRDLSNILEDFHFRKPCQGVAEETLTDVKVTDKCSGIKEGNVWRSKECLGLTDPRGYSAACSKCRILKKYLKRITKIEPNKLEDHKKRYKRRLNTSQRAVKRLKSKLQTFSATIDELRKERQRLIWNGFDAKIKVLNPKEQLVVKTMMAKAKVNPGRDDRLTAMRYDPEFLADCLLIKQKSSAVYRHLRSKGILPLPSEATLLRMAKKTNVEGLNSEQAGQVHHSDQPHQNPLDSDQSNALDVDPSTPTHPLEENMGNKRSVSPDFTGGMSPEIVLPDGEEITVSISEEMIVEIYSVE